MLPARPASSRMTTANLTIVQNSCEGSITRKALWRLHTAWAGAARHCNNARKIGSLIQKWQHGGSGILPLVFPAAGSRCHFYTKLTPHLRER